MKRTLCFTASLALAALARAGEVTEADPARLAADPGAYMGAAVSVAAGFSKIDNGRDPWEEQGDLKTSRVIKFTVSSFGGMKCYAKRTPQNMEALTGLKKGARLILTGVVKKYRPAVKTEDEVTDRMPGSPGGARRGGPERRRWGARDMERTVYGADRYVFMVESVSRAE